MAMLPLLNDKLSLPMLADQTHFKERMPVRAIVRQMRVIGPVQQFHRSLPHRDLPQTAI